MSLTGDLLARRGRLLVALVAAGALAVHLPHLLGNLHQDFFIYRTGARLGLRGHSPYDHDALRAAVRGQYPGDDALADNCGFFLAPQAVVVFAPFAALPWPVAKAAWSVLSFGLAGLAAWYLPVFAADPGRARRFAPLVAAGVLLNPVAVMGMAVAQTSLLVFACVVLGEAAHRAGWRRLAGLLWAVPFIKPHLALPLVPLAWYLGGWRRAAELVLWVAALNVLGGLAGSGSPLLAWEYLGHLSAHKAVVFNLAELNPQITSWNRLLIALGGPAVEQTAATTLAGYAVWGGLVLMRVWLAGSRPTAAWAVAVAAVGALLCCQLLGYELVLLGLVVPLALDLGAAGRRLPAAVLLGLLAFASVPFEAVQAVAAGTALESHRSIAVALVAVMVLAVGWRRPLKGGQSARVPGCQNSATSPHPTRDCVSGDRVTG